MYTALAVVIGVIVVGGWIHALFTKSGREHLMEEIRQSRAFETKRTIKRAYGVERLLTPFGSRYHVVTTKVPRKGWWQASDGKWYPPESHPRYRPPPPPPRSPKPLKERKTSAQPPIVSSPPVENWASLMKVIREHPGSEATNRIMTGALLGGLNAVKSDELAAECVKQMISLIGHVESSIPEFSSAVFFPPFRDVAREELSQQSDARLASSRSGALDKVGRHFGIPPAQ